MTVNELRDLLAGYPGSAVVDISKAVSRESGSVTYRFGVFMDGTVYNHNNEIEVHKYEPWMDKYVGTETPYEDWQIE